LAEDHSLADKETLARAVLLREIQQNHRERAAAEVRAYFLIKNKAQFLPPGLEARDLLADALVNILAKPLVWDSTRAPLWALVTVKMKNILSEMLRKHRGLSRVEPGEDKQDVVEKHHWVQPAQEDAVFLAETDRFMSKITQKDAEARAVARAMLQGNTTPKEIESATGLPIERIETIYRRLNRNLQWHRLVVPMTAVIDPKKGGR